MQKGHRRPKRKRGMRKRSIRTRGIIRIENFEGDGGIVSVSLEAVKKGGMILLPPKRKKPDD